MTSHVRHRRGLPIPPLIEPGEVHVDAPSRQLTAGDIDPARGVPVPMIAVRYFDARASYLAHDYVVQDGGLYRSIAAVPPGPFNAAQWMAIVGGSTSPTDPTHTPLHGFGDGANHTLILHGVTDNASIANAIDFNSLSGATRARIWTTGQPADTLRIQSGGIIALAPGNVTLNDSANVLEVGVNLAVVRNRTGSGGIILQNAGDNAFTSSLRFWNASSQLCSNVWANGNYGQPLWLQSAGAINLVANHSAMDGDEGAGTRLQLNFDGAYLYGALRTVGNAYIAGYLTLGSWLYLPHDGEIHNDSGFMVIKSEAGLYLRGKTAVVIADSPIVPTTVGGTLQVGGHLTAAVGGTFSNDLTVYRSSAPTTGFVAIGGGGKGLYFDGTDLNTRSMRGIAVNEPVNAEHAASKNYVDAKVGSISPAGSYLPLAGGTMAGNLVTAGSGNVDDGAFIGSALTVTGAGATWASISFAIPGVFGANLGLKSDGNFWVGGWSHGVGVSYKLLTTRDVPLTPIVDTRLVYVTDEDLEFHPAAGAPSDPFPGAVVTGITSLIGTTPVMTYVRYRYMQVRIGDAWFTTSMVGP